MNSKNIKPITDHNLCMKCLKEKATQSYHIWGRGYGSEFDGYDTHFQCCDKCDSDDYLKWFGEQASPTDDDDYISIIECEDYQHEYKILELIHNLPLESQELFYNTFNKNRTQDLTSQEWIDGCVEDTEDGNEDSLKKKKNFNREKKNNGEIEELFTKNFKEDGKDMVFLGYEVQMEVEIFKDKTVKVLTINNINVADKEIYI